MSPAARIVAFWFLFAVTAAIYLVMVGWSLPTVSAGADGAVPFDLRPLGYGFDEARDFLAALAPDATLFYLDVQQRLDLAYPALLALTLFLAIAWLAPVRWGRWRWIVALVAIPGAVFDYAENGAVAGMLRLGADGITPDMVAAASRWSMLKSAATTIAMVILLLLLLVWIGARLFGRRGT